MGKIGKKPRKKIHRVYDDKIWQKCLESVTSEGKMIYHASKASGIPYSTIKFRLGAKWSKKTRKGPPTVLLPEEEQEIVGWLKEMERRGFPVVKDTLLYRIKTFLEKSSKPNPFKNNLPGRKWFAGFLDRHKGSITLRTPEAVSAASAKVSEEDIRNWFIRVGAYIGAKGLGEILLEPNRVYNGDETSFFLHPKTKAVLATPGNRNVYEVEHASSHTNITVMFTFGADGSMVPPDIILPLQRVRPELLRSFPGDWGIGKSPKGWMDVENFLLYVKNVFYPFLLKHEVKLPILYFVDGHSSHTAVEVADLCLDLGIILVALYPNTTRITQPADVSIFKPLKNAWKSAVAAWRSNNEGDIWSLNHFSSVLQEAIKQGIKQRNIINGFRVCGLFPFDVDNVDYSKCIAHSTTGSASSSSGVSNNSNLAPTNMMSGPACDMDNESSADVSTHTPLEGLHESPTIQDESGPNLQFTTHMDHSIVMPYSVIKDALDCIGEDLLSRIRSMSPDLNSDETKINELYKKLLKPFDNTTNDDLERRISESTIPLICCDDQPKTQGCLYEPVKDYTCPVVSIPSGNTGQQCTVSIVDNNLDTGFASQQQCGVLQDQTNEQQSNKQTLPDTVCISDFLKIPPALKRNVKNRNYKKSYHPVLTAEERLLELQRIEDEKQAAISEKQIKVEKRELAKQEAETWKKLKAEMGERKKEESLLRRTMKENLRQEKRSQADLKKRKNKDLLFSLKKVS